MKGMFADADILEQNALNRALFPDSPYRYVSGGDPASIPDLTYEKFVETHRRFYAPSNALIFLDGAVNLGAVSYTHLFGIQLQILKRGEYCVIRVSNQLEDNDLSPEKLEGFYRQGYTTKAGHDGVGLSSIRTCLLYTSRCV